MLRRDGRKLMSGAGVYSSPRPACLRSGRCRFSTTLAHLTCGARRFIRSMRCGGPTQTCTSANERSTRARGGVGVPNSDLGCPLERHTAPIAGTPALRGSRLAAAELSTAFWERDFFAIPVVKIAGLDAVWFASEAFWVNNSPSEDVPLSPPAEEFSPFDAAAYDELPDVPSSYHGYLRRQRKRGRPPLQFPKIPHVLVAGAIDVAGLELVRADQRRT